MKNYKLMILFHAENDEDAEEQSKRALDGFDDGFQEAWLQTGLHEDEIRIDPQN